MSYVNATMARDAIIKMKEFHEDLIEIHEKYHLDFFQDLGRRNSGGPLHEILAVTGQGGRTCQVDGLQVP